MENGVGLLDVLIQELHGFLRWQDEQFNLAPLSLTFHLIHDWQCSFPPSPRPTDCTSTGSSLQEKAACVRRLRGTSWKLSFSVSPPCLGRSPRHSCTQCHRSKSARMRTAGTS